MMRKSAPGEEGIQVKKGTFWKSMEGKTRNNHALWFPLLRHLGGLLLGVGFLMKEKEIFVKILDSTVASKHIARGCPVYLSICP